MNIAVLLKQTFDTEAKISLTPEGGVNGQGVKLIINPYDEFALEEALRIKEKSGGEVVVVSAGGEQVQEALRTALATGADKAIMVSDPALDSADEHTYARVLAAVLKTINYDMIFAGWRAVDDGSAQVALRVAEILDIPHVNVITELTMEGGQATAKMEVEGGQALVEVPLPALFTAQKGLNEPRYPSMKGIMQSKKKPLEKMTLSDLNLTSADVAARTAPTCYFLPAERQAGRIVSAESPQDAVKELARLLREEAKVI